MHTKTKTVKHHGCNKKKKNRHQCHVCICSSNLQELMLLAVWDVWFGGWHEDHFSNFWSSARSESGSFFMLYYQNNKNMATYFDRIYGVAWERLKEELINFWSCIFLCCLFLHVFWVLLVHVVSKKTTGDMNFAIVTLEKSFSLLKEQFFYCIILKMAWPNLEDSTKAESAAESELSTFRQTWWQKLVLSGHK